MATGVKIQSAKYGVGTTDLLDVTGAVNAHLENGKLHFVVAPSALNVTDPAPGQIKTLSVTYSINGGDSNTLTAVDGEAIDIDAPPARIASGLQIVKAQYGYQGNFQDVTNAVRTYLNNGSINVTVSPSTMGIPDPDPRKAKQLKVDVKINGDPSSHTINDGQVFKLNAPPANTNTATTASQDFMNLLGTIVSDFFLFCFWFYLFSITILSAKYGDTLFTGGKWILGFLALVTLGIFPIFILPMWLFVYHIIFG